MDTKSINKTWPLIQCVNNNTEFGNSYLNRAAGENTSALILNSIHNLAQFTITVETRYTCIEIWYNKLIFSGPKESICFVLYFSLTTDINTISDITNKHSRSQGSHYTEFPLYHLWQIPLIKWIYFSKIKLVTHCFR